MPLKRASTANAKQSAESGVGHSKSTSGGSSGTLHGGRNETASALERIEDCIDFSGQKTGDYNGLVSVLLHHQYSAEVVEPALEAVIKMMEHNVPSVFDKNGEHVTAQKTNFVLKKYAEEVCESGIIMHIIGALNRHCKVRAIVQAACTLIRYLLRSDMYRHEFLKCHAAKTVIMTMAANASDQSIQKVACQTLVVLAWDQATVGELGTLGGITATIKAMNTHKKHAAFQDQAWRLLSHMAHHDGNAAIITKEGGVDMIVKAMASAERDKATQVRGLRAIQRIADNGDEGVKNQLAKSGGLTAVVQGMKSHASDPVAQEKGCGAIAALAQNGNAREGIIEQGGIEACLEAMARHAEHTPTQKQGCLALKEMAGSLEDRERVVKNKGVKIIVEAMRKHGQDVGVCEYGCAALMRLAFDPPTAIAIGNEAGIHDIIINAMKDHPLSPEVQEEACWVIIFLTSDKKHEKIFIKGGAVKIVKEAVERHFDVDSLQEQGRMALDNLGPKGREESLKLKRQQDSLKVEVGGGGEAGEVGVEKSACCVVM